MYFDFRAFFRLAYMSFFEIKTRSTQFTFKRVIFLVCFFGFFPLIQLFNCICFLLDDILFPGYRKLEMKHPVFVIGNPRSGTTFIHRLMARDRERFFCFKTWEIIFPAIIQKKLFSLVGRIDKLAGSILSKAVRRFEIMLLGDFLDKHPTGLFYQEEDEMLLIHIFSSVYLMFFFPFFSEVESFIRFDLAVKPENRKRIMTFYINCIKRQAYFKGGNGILLSKNPAFSPKVDTLYKYFPDCKIIYLVRNPIDVVPSMISDLLATCVYSLNKTEEVYYFQNSIYETAKFFYEYPLEKLLQTPSSSYLIINYEDLVESPSKTIQRIYDHFGFEFTSDYLKVLAKEEAKAKEFKSRHTYSLNQFQLSREKIVSDFNMIFEQFGFDKRGSTSTE